MDRRTFIGAGTGAGLLGALTLTEASPLPALTAPFSAGPLPPPPDLDAYLATLDEGLAAIAGGDLSSFASGEGRDFGSQAPLARGALRALYVTGMVGDLPVETQVDPRVQERLWRIAPEVNETVEAMLAHLDELTSSEWLDLQTTLRQRTNPGIEIADALIREGATAGLSPRRRLQTRAMITHLSLRLRSQPPEVVVQEYRAKVERIEASDGIDLMARRKLAATLGEEVFWELGGRSVLEGQATPGLRTLGWGLGITAAGAVIVLAGAIPGVFVMTVGVIVLLVGLIQLIVHALS